MVSVHGVARKRLCMGPRLPRLSGRNRKVNNSVGPAYQTSVRCAKCSGGLSGRKERPGRMQTVHILTMFIGKRSSFISAVTTVSKIPFSILRGDRPHRVV